MFVVYSIFYIMISVYDTIGKKGSQTLALPIGPLTSVHGVGFRVHCFVYDSKLGVCLYMV